MWKIYFFYYYKFFWNHRLFELTNVLYESFFIMSFIVNHKNRQI